MSKEKAAAATMRIVPRSVAEWSSWLQRHHMTERAVTVVHWKAHTGRRAMTAPEAMKEAIRFGWIDTIVKSLGAEQFEQRFAKRNATSRWSHNTLRYAEELLHAGLLTPAGVAAYEHGLMRPLFNETVGQGDHRRATCKTTKRRLTAIRKHVNGPSPVRRRVRVGQTTPRCSTKKKKQIVIVKPTRFREARHTKRDPPLLPPRKTPAEVGKKRSAKLWKDSSSRTISR